MFKITGLIFILGFILMACEAHRPPINAEFSDTVGAYQAEYRIDPRNVRDEVYVASYGLNQRRCTAPFPQPLGAYIHSDPDLLSPGDILAVDLEFDETFSGRYEVSRSGELHLPYLAPVRAAGRTTQAVEADLKAELIKAQIYDNSPQISVRLADFTEAAVYVSGAVFRPAGVIVGRSNKEPDLMRQDAIGAYTSDRNLSRALLSADGVRPDADLSNIMIKRAGKIFRVDMSPLIRGGGVIDPILVNGDEIIVPTRNCFQSELMRPGPITRPGIMVYMSNLISPASNNAAASIDKDVRQLPYGTRMMQAAINMNCAGGSKTANANRTVALFSRNPITNRSIVVERNLEDMLRRPDRDELDPYLLPGDALVCYNNALTNISDVARSIGSIVTLGILSQQFESGISF